MWRHLRSPKIFNQPSVKFKHNGVRHEDAVSCHMVIKIPLFITDSPRNSPARLTITLHTFPQRSPSKPCRCLTSQFNCIFSFWIISWILHKPIDNFLLLNLRFSFIHLCATKNARRTFHSWELREIPILISFGCFVWMDQRNNGRRRNWNVNCSFLLIFRDLVRLRIFLCEILFSFSIIDALIWIGKGLFLL